MFEDRDRRGHHRERNGQHDEDVGSGPQCLGVDRAHRDRLQRNGYRRTHQQPLDLLAKHDPGLAEAINQR